MTSQISALSGRFSSVHAARERKRNAALNEMTFMTGQDYGADGDTETARIYNRIAVERNERTEQRKAAFRNMKTFEVSEQERKENVTVEMQTLTEQQMLGTGAHDSPPRMDDTTIIDDDDDKGFNIDEFFEEDAVQEKLTASDGKIIFSHNSAFIKNWSNAVIILAMYNSITIPIGVFYGEHGPSFISSQTIALVDAIVDLIFLIDVIITFRTTYLDTSKGCEETDTHKIALTYLKGSFAVDFASSVPFTSFVSETSSLSSVLGLLGLLKLLRIQRLSAAVTSSNLPQGTKVYLKILMMAFELIVVMHVLGSIWFFLVINAERWVQNMDFMYNGQDQAYQGYFEGDENFVRKHLVMLYTAFYVFTVGEIVPRASSQEFAFSFLLESICTIVNAIIIGYMTAYMDELSKKSAELTAKINLTNTAMINLALSRPLKNQISKYIYNTHTTKNLQTEMTGFLDQLKPSLRSKVTKSSFICVVEQNYVMRRLLKERTEQIFTMSMQLQKTTVRNSRKKFQDKLITILVNQFDNVFTVPDGIYITQDDSPWVDPNEGGDDDDEADQEQSFMYFIRTGQFEVSIKSSYNPEQDEEPKPFKKQLYDGDHFGEIGLMYNSKRTATVKSKNYGSLARLHGAGFKELSSQFQNLTTSFKEYAFKYKDDLRTFLEMECDKIKYFRDLSMITKQELLYNMERKTYNEGSAIFEQGHVIDRMIIIQSGVVQLSIPYDKRCKEEFVIERLTSGAILNHQAFVVQDLADTDYICRTPVSCFELTYDRWKSVMVRRADLQQARKDIKHALFTPHHQIALDYVFHNHAESPEEYGIQLHKNELKVKIKNAVMQVWSQVKRESQPKNISTLIAEMIERKKKKDELLGLKKNRGDNDDEKSEEQKLVNDSKTSYFTLNQYNVLNKRISEAQLRMKEQQKLIESIDTRVSDTIGKIHERRRSRGTSSALSAQQNPLREAL